MYRVSEKCCLIGVNISRRLALRNNIVLHPLNSTMQCQQFDAPYSTDPARRPSFFKNLLENLKSEYDKNKEMKESLSKFREEAKKLEESDALKEARRKFENIEGASKPTAGAFKEQISGFSEKIKEQVDDLSKHESFKKASEFTGNIGDKTKGAAESIGKAAENIGQTRAVKTAISAATNIKEELEVETLGGRVYRPPPVLRMRKAQGDSDGEAIQADEETTGMELHKDSRFAQSWQNFKDNNPVMNKFTDYRVKFEESDSPLARGTRIVTEKLSDMFGSVFTRTELSETLTEICKMDPNFEKEQFLKDCEQDIIPNILEAIVRGDLEILEDWCYEAPFNILATPLRQAKQMGYLMHSQVLDIDSINLFTGKMMEQGPVLVLTFNSQQVICVKDREGKVIEGSKDKVMRITYVWALCRDQTELDPRAAWRLLDLSASSQEQFI